MANIAKLHPTIVQKAREAADRERCIITAPPGLGKDILALKALTFMKDKKKYPCLVVTPKGVINYWANLLAEAWIPFSIFNKDNRLPGPAVTLTNYEQLRNVPEYKLWGHVIFSNGDRLFNRATMTYNMAASIRRENTFITVNPEKIRSLPSDLFSMLSLVDPNKYKSFYAFRTKYSSHLLESVIERYIVSLTWADVGKI